MKADLFLNFKKIKVGRRVMEMKVHVRRKLRRHLEKMVGQSRIISKKRDCTGSV